MRLNKNGYVVSQIKDKDYRYNIWPLEEMENDQKATDLTYEADKTWFLKYPMQQIVPDFNYTERYVKYCREIGLNVRILLYETPDAEFIINEEHKISQILGYDCMGSVYYSYLKEEYFLFNDEMEKLKIILNDNNLCISLKDVISFMDLRTKAKKSGWDLEDYWKETPTKISVLDY